MNYKTINYSNIFFTYIHSQDAECSFFAKDHALIYVYSGKLKIEEKGITRDLYKGDCAFIRRDNQVILHKHCAENGEPYISIALTFTRKFLLDFYNNLDKKNIPVGSKRSTTSLMKIDARPDIISLFESLKPYHNSTIEPDEKWIRLKLTEGLYALLNTDKNIYSSLFDFTEPWKIDLLDFMNDNYMFDLTLEEIANYTGRSLATFKRDFSKISDLSPQKWLIKKRLDMAHHLMQNQKMKVTDVIHTVGFKNLSHFSKLYKLTYGHPPTQRS